MTDSKHGTGFAPRITFASAEVHEVDPKTIEVHPLANLMPAMQVDEQRDLVARIRADGQIEPGLLFDGRLLDGRHRRDACIELALPMLVRHYTGDRDPLVMVLALNASRRSLTPGQRAAVGFDLTQGELIDRRLKRDEAASLAGCSPTDISHFAAIAKADPELAGRVRSGEITLGKARGRAAASPVPTPAKPMGTRSPLEILEALPEAERSLMDAWVEERVATVVAGALPKLSFGPEEAESARRLIAVRHNATAAQRAVADKLLELVTLLQQEPGEGTPSAPRRGPVTPKVSAAESSAQTDLFGFAAGSVPGDDGD